MRATFLLLCLSGLAAPGGAFAQHGVQAPPLVPGPAEDLPRVPDGKAYATEQWRLGNYDVALAYFAQAYADDKAAGDVAGMAGDLNQIGLIQWRLNDCASAMAAYSEAAHLAEQGGLERLLGLTYLNRAILLKNQGLTDSAFAMNAVALRTFQRLGHVKDLALALNNEGQIHKHLGAYGPAQEAYRRSLALCEAAADTGGMATACFNLGDVHGRQRHPDSAFHYVHRALALARSVRTKVQVSEALDLLAQLHETYGRPDSALAYFKAYARYTDSLDAVNKARGLAILQAQLGAEVKDLRIRTLQSEQRLQRTRALAAVAGLLLLGLGAGLVLRRRWRQARVRKRMLEAELDSTRRLLNDRDRELREHLLALSEQAAEIQRMKGALATPTDRHIAGEGEVAELLEQKILTDEDWGLFKDRFSTLYPDFFARTRSLGLALTEGDVRYLVLLRLGLAPKEMADLLGISPQSARVGKLRLRKKLAAAGHPSVDDLLERLIA